MATLHESIRNRKEQLRHNSHKTVKSSPSDPASPVFVDLFCGAGGLSEGLVQAGFTPVLGVDFNPHAAETYRLNHPEATVLERDISKVSGDEIRLATGRSEFDLVAGGPSCQGFSTHGKRLEDDPRNFLFKHFVRLVGELRPKFFLMENVKGLLTYRKGHFRILIEQSFASIGYRVNAQVVCAADYGVPQFRHRIVFIGTRTDVPITFPSPTHGPEGLHGENPYVTVGQAIGDLPLLDGAFEREIWEYASSPQNDYQRYCRKQVRAKHVTLHQANGMSQNAREIVKLVKEGQGLRDIPPALLPARFKRMRRIKNGSLRRDCTTLYFRVARSRPSYTITTFFRNVASGAFVHPVEDRSFSYREAARFMSFPDHYLFSPRMLPLQIGNSVPPLLGKAFGLHVKKLLKLASRSQLGIAA